MSQISIKSALHTAINNLPTIIPPSGVRGFDGRVVTTLQPHGLLTGVAVSFVGTSFDGYYIVNVLSPTTFSLRTQDTGASFVSTPCGTGGVVTPQLIAWPNIAFDPVGGVPFEKVNVIFAKPQEPTAGSDFYRENGMLQVTLYYPLLQGDGPAMSRAELIRKAFPKGSSVTKDNIVVRFNNVAQIIEGVSTDESYIVVIRIPFYADIYS